MGSLIEEEGDIVRLWEIEYRLHATRRMFQRNIHEDDVEAVLFSGKVIERYGEDFPFPSRLICGRTSTGGPLHLVVALNHEEKTLIIITAYEPDPGKWGDGFSRRIK
jgi:hypothetical protein